MTITTECTFSVTISAGETQLGALGAQRLRDAPGDRTLVGYASDQALLPPSKPPRYAHYSSRFRIMRFPAGESRGCIEAHTPEAARLSPVAPAALSRRQVSPAYRL
jgi:hypothetical protein